MAIINKNKGQSFPYGKHYAVTLYESAWICFHVANNGKPRSFLFFLTGHLGPVVLGSVIYKPSFGPKERSKVDIKLRMMSLLACMSFTVGRRSPVASSLVVSYPVLNSPRLAF
jgi:hypothetical protein